MHNDFTALLLKKILPQSLSRLCLLIASSAPLPLEAGLYAGFTLLTFSSVQLQRLFVFQPF